MGIWAQTPFLMLSKRSFWDLSGLSVVLAILVFRKGPGHHSFFWHAGLKPRCDPPTGLHQQGALCSCQDVRWRGRNQGCCSPHRPSAQCSVCTDKPHGSSLEIFTWQSQSQAVYEWLRKARCHNRVSPGWCWRPMHTLEIHAGIHREHCHVSAGS